MTDKAVADFTLPATGKLDFNLHAHRGRPLVIYFYPKDNTPGCTTETTQFRDLHTDFAQRDCAIYGLSRDSLKSHENFKAKLGLPFELISDPDEIACTLFGVIKQKKLYGKEVRGIERSTFLFDAKGQLQHEWRGVKADGHADDVLKTLTAMLNR